MTSRTLIRRPAVAGLFYPSEEDALQNAVSGYLSEALIHVPKAKRIAPKALVVPHAGYVYSASVASSAYAYLACDNAREIRRVVLLGPAHRLAFRGLALPGVNAFETPLGCVQIDTDGIAETLKLKQVRTLPEAHKDEHCLEVHLPFLQMVLRDFAIVPLVVGSTTACEVAQVIETLWGDEETLIVISTDLSHYHDYHVAKSMDAATSAAIEALDEQSIGTDQACGLVPLSGLLIVARAHGLSAQTIDVRNSADTAGGHGKVVGYGAYIVA